MTAYIGYHGTDKNAAKLIVDSQKFRPSLEDDEWLGKGVYFYWDIDDARWWCTDYKKLDAYAVLHSRLPAGVVVDLVHSRSDQENFRIFCDKVKSKSERLPNGKKRRNYMSLALELMIRLKPPDIIIGAFDENRKFWYTAKDLKDKFPIIVSQIQICVLNAGCISDTYIYEEVG